MQIKIGELTIWADGVSCSDCRHFDENYFCRIFRRPLISDKKANTTEKIMDTLKRCKECLESEVK